jgi:hypothetical protein
MKIILSKTIVEAICQDIEPYLSSSEDDVHKNSKVRIEELISEYYDFINERYIVDNPDFDKISLRNGLVTILNEMRDEVKFNVEVENFRVKYFGSFANRDLNNLRRTTDRPDKELNQRYQNFAIEMYKIHLSNPNNVIISSFFERFEQIIAKDSSTPIREILFTVDEIYYFRFIPSAQTSSCRIDLIDPVDDPGFMQDLFMNSKYYKEMIAFQYQISQLDSDKTQTSTQ